jgi:hypothetical protein
MTKIREVIKVYKGKSQEKKALNLIYTRLKSELAPF